MVKAIERTANAKTGLMSATYAAQVTCPDSCVWRDAGCYAEVGPMAFTTRRLNRDAVRVKPLMVARAESKAIAGLSGSLPLRLHVVGDAPTDGCARVLARAAKGYRAKHGMPVFTYTHAWRDVSRESWGNVSVLASCETPQDVREATARGYKTALIVGKFADSKRYEVDGVRVIPCPQQTGKSATCQTCKLCLGGNFAGTIGFEAHGARARKVRETLLQIGGAA